MRRLLAQGLKPHRDQLPPLPTAHSEREDHTLCEWLKDAEKEHLDSHHKMRSWTEVPAKKIRATGQQILDCMWVYTYKLDKNHHLLKCKARLVVQGDQQQDSTSQDIYAATLASRSFRMLMAIAAHRDLELRQYDVTNAFVHASIDREVYMRMPHGHQKPGTILQVNKALYGLRISPLLWEKEFTSILVSLGFKIVLHEACCLIRNDIIVFFYVDDIIVAFAKAEEQDSQQAIKLLQGKCTLTGGNELQWFLGVEVVRDRSNKRIQLSQASYIE